MFTLKLVNQLMNLSKTNQSDILPHGGEGNKDGEKNEKSPIVGKSEGGGEINVNKYTILIF